MRRVVITTSQDGRSCIASDEEIADTGLFWTVDRTRAEALIDAVDPERGLRAGPTTARRGAVCSERATAGKGHATPSGVPTGNG